MNSKLHLTYSDVRIKPKTSSVTSRKNVSLELERSSLSLPEVPLINAPMESVACPEMARFLIEDMKTMCTYHRFNDYYEEILELFDGRIDASKLIPSTGLVPDEGSMTHNIFINKLNIYEEEGVEWILIDTAYGNSTVVADTVEYIEKNFDFNIIAGNVATKEGAQLLFDSGTNAVRTGIGHGSACLTAVNTGIGVPMISAIQDVASVDTHLIVIADGGIKHPGDVAKAIAAGADICMAGSLFAACEESRSESFMENGKRVKRYWGSASPVQKGEHGGYVEGGDALVNVTGSTRDLMTRFKHGLQSACSYVGASTLNEFHKYSELIRVTSKSHSEGFIHAS